MINIILVLIFLALIYILCEYLHKRNEHKVNMANLFEEEFNYKKAHFTKTLLDTIQTSILVFLTSVTIAIIIASLLKLYIL